MFMSWLLFFSIIKAQKQVLDKSVMPMYNNFKQRRKNMAYRIADSFMPAGVLS